MYYTRLTSGSRVSSTLFMHVQSPQRPRSARPSKEGTALVVKPSLAAGLPSSRKLQQEVTSHYIATKGLPSDRNKAASSSRSTGSSRGSGSSRRSPSPTASRRSKSTAGAGTNSGTDSSSSQTKRKVSPRRKKDGGSATQMNPSPVPRISTGNVTAADNGEDASSNCASPCASSHSCTSSGEPSFASNVSSGGGGSHLEGSDLRPWERPQGSDNATVPSPPTPRSAPSSAASAILGCLQGISSGRERERTLSQDGTDDGTSSIHSPLAGGTPYDSGASTPLASPCGGAHATGHGAGRGDVTPQSGQSPQNSPHLLLLPGAGHVDGASEPSPMGRASPPPSHIHLPAPVVLRPQASAVHVPASSAHAAMAHIGPVPPFAPTPMLPSAVSLSRLGMEVLHASAPPPLLPTPSSTPRDSPWEA